MLCNDADLHLACQSVTYAWTSGNPDRRRPGSDQKYGESRLSHRVISIETKVRALPGIQSVSLAASVPMGSTLGNQSVYIEDRRLPSGQRAPGAFFNSVNASYFDTLRIHILLGRSFTETDSETSPRVAIVNETMAGIFGPAKTPSANALVWPAMPARSSKSSVSHATASTAFSLKIRSLTFMSLSRSTSRPSVPCRFVPRYLSNRLPPSFNTKYWRSTPMTPSKKSKR
jgi:hypothetical protein